MVNSKVAVFLDRDGTIIEDRGYLKSPAEAHFIPGVFAALRELSPACVFFIVTNQSGVAKGLTTEAEVAAVNDFVVAELRRNGVEIADVYVCPHDRGDGCVCRKPAPHFLHRAAAEHGLDLSRAYVVGDHPHDVETALAAGATGVYVLTGHGCRHIGEIRDSPSGRGIVANDLATAAAIIAAEIPALAAKRPPVPENVATAAWLLRRGGLVAFPTETVYGLGANALDPAAAARIFALKKRPSFDPLIVHLGAADWLDKFCKNVPAAARRLAEAFWPGPLTLVLDRRDMIPETVTAGLPTVAVRVPAHSLALELIRATKLPLAAPSANPFGGISPTTAAHVAKGLPEGIDWLLDGGACQVGIESTIIRVGADGALTLLRPGGLAIEAIAEVCRIVPATAAGVVETHCRAMPAPGMLARHYSPATPVALFEHGGRLPFERTDTLSRCGLLLNSKHSPMAAEAGKFARVEFLSESGGGGEMARNLFAALQRCDRCGLAALYIEMAPDTGLGRAVNDRLRRAAGTPPQELA